MPVSFDLERMRKVRENHMLWWRGELDRPLVKMTLSNARPLVKTTDAPLLSQANCHDFSWSPEECVAAMDDWLSTQEYVGDGYPFINFDSFGPGVLAAFCGGVPDNSSGAVWFSSPKEMEIADIHVKYDPENKWAQRIKALYRAGWERWNGTVVMGMPDLGGVMDVMASLRGTDNLLMDLYDDPEEVLRLRGEIETAWDAAYDDFRAAMAPQMPYTDWNGILSDTPSYIIQSDFSYMIGNPMFKEFVLDSLKHNCRRLSNVIYHLDGIGELKHLDDILSIEGLNAVQWVYGDGQPGPIHWIEVYEKIRNAGKSIMICGAPQEYMEALSVLHGTPYTTCTIDAKDSAFAAEVLRAR